MVTDAPTAMPTDRAILILTQWLSPAYPVGAFAYSHGLESAVQTGQVRDRDGLAEWLDDVLNHGSGRSDALLLAAAYAATSPDRLREIDSIARAFAPSRERLLETDQIGAAFGAVTGHVWAQDTDAQGTAALAYPVALGYAARLENLPLNLTSALYLQAFVGNLVTAAQRLLPLGQRDAQALIAGFADTCTRIARATAHGDLDHLSGTAFLADIASMQHETQYSRMFRT